MVSIITPSYNSESYIIPCINSVINQSYRNWEMIIIDDNSQDNTAQIIESFSKIEKRIRFIKHRANWGIKNIENIYNEGLTMSKGKYIALLEGDDFWPKDKLIKQVYDFNNKEIVLSFGDWIITDNEGKELKIGDYTHFPRNKLMNQPIGSILNLFFNLNFYLITSTIMIKRETLLKINGFKKDSDYPFTDIPTYLNLSLQGNFSYHNDILGYYRKHENSSSFIYHQRTELLTRKEIQKYYLSFIHSNKNKFKEINLKFDLKNIRSKQSIYLKSKKKHKQLIIFFHYLSFNNKGSLILLFKKIMRSFTTPLTDKFISLIIVVTFPVYFFYRFIYFSIQLTIYKLKQGYFHLRCLID